MIDIQRTIAIQSPVVSNIADAVLTESAVSTNNSNHTRIHLPDGATTAQQSIAQSILDNYGALPVSASATALSEGDSDPVMTCDDSSIVSDSDMGYVVLLDGDIYAEGTTSVDSGEATLTLVSPIAGVYEVFLYRRTGNYASGSIQITVSEV